ncbi:hypothetical protein ABW19_dt0209723 [Dactylella cylindrospora]|nr:hypothetical protein ABW19_dt0209723 [Dactylella cylindrospora]
MPTINSLLYPRQWTFQSLESFVVWKTTRRSQYSSVSRVLFFVSFGLYAAVSLLNMVIRLYDFMQSLISPKSVLEEAMKSFPQMSPGPSHFGHIWVCDWVPVDKDGRPVQLSGEILPDPDFGGQVGSKTQVEQDIANSGGFQWVGSDSDLFTIALVLLVLAGMAQVFFIFWKLYLPEYEQLVRDCLAHKFRYEWKENPFEGDFWYNEEAPYEELVKKGEKLTTKYKRWKNVRGDVVYIGPEMPESEGYGLWNEEEED